MKRYNHRLSERKWRQVWATDGHPHVGSSRAWVQLFPGDPDELELENARLLVLADFFATWFTGAKPVLFSPTLESPWATLAEQLDLRLAKGQGVAKDYDLIVQPRDLAPLPTVPQGNRILVCGRLLRGMKLSELLPDFGADALRLFFLNLGPLERDYSFEWDNLVSAFRATQRLWLLGQGARPQGGDTRTASLEGIMQTRIEQKKPHTAFAAALEFLKDKSMLTKVEVRTLARLLQSYTPFLAAELLSLIAAVEEDDSRN